MSEILILRYTPETLNIMLIKMSVKRHSFMANCQLVSFQHHMPRSASCYLVLIDCAFYFLSL